ncbi:hypothetical protein L1987_73268 [Smallanthus sonchifolius]|uniref:Uncharacterized protein n=1 Tax=Smallanthus sonchifolius TaxID=185202 RepID=A0ACB9A0N0_9ASTR|nr:hypothetical protein L1987_73268 [Smallanthus sonchifolius]
MDQWVLISGSRVLLRKDLRPMNLCYIDSDQMEKSAVLFRPKLIVAATTPEYKAYQEQVLANCKKFSQFDREGYDLVSGGTDNHLVLGIDGSRVEKIDLASMIVTGLTSPKSFILMKLLVLFCKSGGKPKEFVATMNGDEKFKSEIIKIRSMLNNSTQSGLRRKQ